MVSRRNSKMMVFVLPFLLPLATTEEPDPPNHQTPSNTAWANGWEYPYNPLASFPPKPPRFSVDQFSRNVSVQVGGSVSFNCKVLHLGEHSVSISYKILH